MKSILVTGCVIYRNAHIRKTFKKNYKVGIDNINNYYDIKIKS